MRLRQERGNDYTYALCRATQCPTLPTHTHTLAYTQTHRHTHLPICMHAYTDISKKCFPPSS